MEDCGDTISYVEVETNVSPLPMMVACILLLSLLLLEQEWQEMVERDEGEEKKVALGLRPFMFEPLAPFDIQ